MPDSYFAAGRHYRQRERLMGILRRAGFRCIVPSGAYYVMTDISGFGFPDDVDVRAPSGEEIGVAAVPGSSFYRDPSRRAEPASLLLLQEGKKHTPPPRPTVGGGKKIFVERDRKPVHRHPQTVRHGHELRGRGGPHLWGEGVKGTTTQRTCFARSTSKASADGNV